MALLSARLLPLSAAYTALAILLVVARVAYFQESVGKGKKVFAPVAYVSVAWFCLWYWFLFQQSATHFQVYFDLIKKAKKEEKDGKKERIDLGRVKKNYYNEHRVAVVNTTVRNTLEQSISFLLLLWLSAFINDSVYDINKIATVGWVWIVARFFYPYVLPQPFPTVFLSTMPGYACQLYFMYKILSGFDPLSFPQL
jgi:hypothetical protein